jgi:hypothetical protein
MPVFAVPNTELAPSPHALALAHDVLDSLTQLTAEHAGESPPDYCR